MSEELQEWKPKHPRLAAIGEYLKRVRDASTLGSLAVGDKGELLTRLAYEQPLTTGKGMTTGLRSEATELADVIPGPTSIGKAGAKMAGVIGPIGILNLGDETLKRKYTKLIEAMRRANPKDWLTQKTIAEDAGFVPIPRGRDMNPERQTIKVGYEIPEGEITPKLMDAAETFYPESERKKRVLVGSYNPKYHPSMSFEEAYAAPRLLRAYPTMKNLQFKGDVSLERGAASFDAAGRKIRFGPQTDPGWMDEIMAHEIQHKIQSAEGWPGGTNSTWAGMLLKDLKDPLPKDMDSPERLKLALKQADLLKKYGNYPGATANAMYRREAGEQLAVASARSHVLGGGQIEKNYTSPFYRMYDIRQFPLRFEE